MTDLLPFSIKCDRCYFSAAKEDGLKCLLKPPQTHVVAVPIQTIQGSQLTLQVVCVLPKVEADGFCDSARPK